MAAVVLAAPAAATAQTAAAQTAAAPAPPPIRIGATIFADYSVIDSPKGTDGAGREITRNAFSVTRTYINVTGSVTSRLSFRITPDITRASDSSLAGSQVFRLKYAYLNLSLPHGTSMRMGMQQTPLIDGQESVYRYRFQGTSFVERDGGLASSDVGLTVRKTFGRHADAHVGIYNGEGYSKPEVNGEKALMARVTLRPAPDHEVAKGLRLIGYIHRDEVLNGAPRNRAALSAMFEHARFNAGVDYIRRTDQASLTAARTTGQGWSVFVTPFLDEKGRGVEGLFRLDHFTPNTAADASWRRLIAGAAYWFPRQGSASAALLANLEQVTYSNFTTARPTDRKIGLYALINF